MAKRRNGTDPPALDRRQELVGAAYRQIARRGFEGLRTREVAAAAGVNVATLHYYFPTKEALIGDVLKHAMQRFRSTMPAGGSPSDQLRNHFAGIRRLVQKEPELFAVMGELALRSARDPAIRELYQQTTDIWQATVRGLLVKAARDGLLIGSRNPDAQASLVVSALTGASMIPLSRPARLTETITELERSLGLDST
ncbi:MAG: TetR/AcrR family transcriptional regulator [Candidatus Dormiibacterota bacterium]